VASVTADESASDAPPLPGAGKLRRSISVLALRQETGEGSPDIFRVSYERGNTGETIIEFFGYRWPCGWLQYQRRGWQKRGDRFLKNGDEPHRAAAVRNPLPFSIAV